MAACSSVGRATVSRRSPSPFEVGGRVITKITDFSPEPHEPPPGREHLVERW
jgi:hypothetical protein